MKEGPEEGVLLWDRVVFRDRHAFEIDHVPETFNHYESRLQSLKYALRPVVCDSRPLNAMVRGPSGTGKTTAVQKLSDELGTQSGVRAVRVNCQVDSMRYAVFPRVFEYIFEYKPSSSGILFKKLFGQITSRLAEDDEVLVVTLDDVGYPFYENEASDTFHSLLRAHEAHSGTCTGVITILSDLSLDVIDELDGYVQSIFQPEEVFFPRYDVDEIVDILRGRSKHGLYEDVTGVPEFDQVAEFTVDNGGLRVSIDPLRRVGLYAEMRAFRTVDVEDVEVAYDKSKYVHLPRRLQGFSDPERELVRVVAEYDGKRAGTVYDVLNGATDLGYTRYLELANKLGQLGVIGARYAEIEGRGRTRAILLACDADAVLDRL